MDADKLQVVPKTDEPAAVASGLLAHLDDRVHILLNAHPTDPLNPVQSVSSVVQASPSGRWQSCSMRHDLTEPHGIPLRRRHEVALQLARADPPPRRHLGGVWRRLARPRSDDDVVELMLA